MEINNDRAVYNASGKVTVELLKTVFKDKPVYENLENGKTGKILSGYVGIYLYGMMGAGKSTDIIKLIERVCMYQSKYKGKRQIHVGVLRNSNADFIGTLGKSFSFWYDEQPNNNFKYGFRIRNQNTRPEVIVRFPSQRPKKMDDGSMQMVNEGVDCEIIYFCYAADKKDDEQKMKGGEFTIAWSNEVNIIHREAHEMLASRANRFPPIGATHSFWIADANPKHTKSWEYKLWIKDGGDKRVKVIHYPPAIKFTLNKNGDSKFKGRIGTWDVNPEATVHRSDYGYWFSMLASSDTFIQNNVLGEYADVVEGHVVHSGYDPLYHENKVEFVPETWQTILIGVDFGVNCGAVFSILTDEGNIKITDEFTSNKGFGNLYKKIKAALSNKYQVQFINKNVIFIGDPRTGKKRDLVKNSTSVDLIFKDFSEDHYVVPRNSSGSIIDSIEYRIEIVDQLLKTIGGFMINPSCKQVIEAFSFGYVVDAHTGKPDKRKSGIYSELCDAIQYIATYISLGGSAMPVSIRRKSIRKSTVYNVFNR